MADQSERAHGLIAKQFFACTSARAAEENATASPITKRETHCAMLLLGNFVKASCRISAIDSHRVEVWGLGGGREA
jgi:hypothetical protein